MPRQTRKIVAIIPASGVGSRMGADIPKQYLKIHDKTILEHTLSPFLQHFAIDHIVVVVSVNDPYYRSIEILNHPKIRIVFGGETRAHSVLNGLNSLEDSENCWALVHDAARPCCNGSDLDNILQITDYNGAILAVPAVDTIKRTWDGKIIAATEDRSTLWHALTPQFFPAKPLKQAIQQGLEKGLAITDEASAMELAGFQPQLVAGRSDNLKVTRPEDLALAEFYLAKQKEQ